MLPERFTSKFIITEDGHWIWLAARLKTGYGIFGIPKSKGRTILAHRFAWIETNGPIPDETPCVLHKNSCHRRDCVNPDHLYLGNQKQNIADALELGTFNPWLSPGVGIHKLSKTHCPKGHPYDEENTYTNNGIRYCRICRKESGSLYRLNHKSA